MTAGAHVYVVRGRAGCYSSTTEWPVRAFIDRGDADALAGRLNAWAVESGASVGRLDEWSRQRASTGTRPARRGFVESA
jgi:hypothetical protein